MRLLKSPWATLRHPIAADQEFLWRVMLQAGLAAQRIDAVLAYFQYGGYSTDRSTRAQNGRERRLLLEQFYSRWELFYYGSRSFCFLNPLKAAIRGLLHKDD